MSNFLAWVILVVLFLSDAAVAQNFVQPAPLNDPFGDAASVPMGIAIEPDPLPAIMPLTDPAAVCPPDAVEAGPAEEKDPDTPRDARSGVFQKIRFRDTWLARIGDRGFGIDDAELQSVWAVPFPTRSWPLVITPGLAAHFLDGPTGVDLPARLYDVYTEFEWLPRLTPQWRADIAVTPGYFSDFESSGPGAFRVTAYGTLIYKWTPNLQLVAGAAYRDSAEWNVLPVGGFIWKPSDEEEYRLLFPAPRIAHRFYWNGVDYPDIENWVYVAGEFGGGTWAIRHADGSNDVVTYSDWRVLLGVERKVLGGVGAKFEVGYVFGRRIQMDSLASDIRPTDTVLVRGGLSY